MCGSPLRGARRSLGRPGPPASIVSTRLWPMSSSRGWLSPMVLKATLSSRAPAGRRSGASRMLELFHALLGDSVRKSRSGAARDRVADHHDGAGGVVHAMLADRPEQRLNEPAMPAAANNQQVGTG